MGNNNRISAVETAGYQFLCKKDKKGTSEME